MPLKMLTFYLWYERELGNQRLRLKVREGILQCINVETLVFKNTLDLFDDSLFNNNLISAYYNNLPWCLSLCKKQSKDCITESPKR